MSWTGAPFFEEKLFDKCLSCGSEQLETLRLQPLGESGLTGQFLTVDRKLKFLRSKHGVDLRGNHFQMCRDCGFLFRQDSPAELKEFLKQYAKE